MATTYIIRPLGSVVILTPVIPTNPPSIVVQAYGRDGVVQAKGR